MSAPSLRVPAPMTEPTTSAASAGWRMLHRHFPPGVWAPCTVALMVLALDWVEGARPAYIGVLAAVPFLAAVFSGVVGTVAVGVACVVMAAAFGFLQAGPDGGTAGATQAQAVRLCLIVAATAGAALASSARVRRDRRLVTLSALAEAARAVVLRPLAPRVGPLRCAVRYPALTPERPVGGDVADVIDTPFGVRFLIGNAEVAGLDAVRTAGQVLDAFREHAGSRPDLGAVALAMDAAIRHGRPDSEPGPGVAVLLGEVRRDGGLQACRCGGSAPVLIRPEGRHELRTDPAGPALGELAGPPALMGWRLHHGDRLVALSATAHRAARSFPVLDAVVRAFEGRDLDEGLDRLRAEVASSSARGLRHLDGRGNDAVMLAVEYQAQG